MPLEGDCKAIPPAREPTLTIPHLEPSLGEAHQAKGDICAGLHRLSPFFGNSPGTSSLEHRVKNVPVKGR